ncbi:MAG: DNA polymerase III subunit alpha [Bacilli bacterium]|nr:DNA polymerase III subunit alpha [Bacilli bacterium]
MRLVPLHVYSGYSFLRSGLSVPRIASLCKKYGHSYVALSDYGALSGFPELYHVLEGSNILPVYGMDVEVEGVLYSLYAKNEDGYRNLVLLNLLNSQKKITTSTIKEHQKGLSIVLSADHSPIYEFYKSGQKGTADWLFKFSKDLEDFYLGVPYIPTDPGFRDFLRSFASHYPYRLLAFPHYIYEKEDDAIVLDIVRAIQNDQNISIKKSKGPNHFLDEETIESYFTSSEIEESVNLASNCHVDLVQKRGGLLHYPNPFGLTSGEYLRKMAYEGLEKKNPGFNEKYKNRLDYELNIIEKMGYSDYFLLVSDYVSWALEHNISVGPGRGSGAASLVSYSLGIIVSDPLKYDLVFERFLNPERKSMPDIDVDFADIKRDQVIEYLIQKYGKDKVAHIMTMQTIGAKQSLRDVGRVYQYEGRVIDLIAKTIVNPFLSLRQNYKTNPQFKQLVDSDPFYLEIVSLAAKIEGLPRQSGLHAAGIVINDTPLEQSIPVIEQEGLGYVVSYEAPYLEEQGFLKMDVLGLRNLSTVDECLRLIKLNHGVEMKPRQIPWEDKEAIELIASGKTMGLFQLESSGIRRTIETVKPTSFEDVVAILALYRPGPMANIPTFAARKKGVEKITYLDPALEDILSPTYGVIVYQEQVMKIVSVMAGFSMGEADLFRRAISKKDAAKLAALKDKFIAGCLKNGHSKKVSEEVYALIYRFADYGFNQAHALAYAVLTCQMAYLKKRYPNEFYAAILDFCSGDANFASYISELKKSGLKLALPDVNKADVLYSVDGDKIIYPLSAIKGIGNAFSYDIVEERNRNGKFADIFDFASRMKKYGLNTQSLVRLVDAGALDSLWPNRCELRLSAGLANSYAEMLFGEDGQQMLLNFEIPKPAMAKSEDNRRENLVAEYEALGIMISGSPLSLHKEAIQRREVATGVKLMRLGELPSINGLVSCVGVIKSTRVINTKKGTRMCFLALYDDTSEAEFVVFDEVYNKCFKALQSDTVVEVKCRKDNRREDAYLAEEIISLEN